MIGNEVLVGIERTQGEGAIVDANPARQRTAQKRGCSGAVVLEGQNRITSGAVALQPDDIRNPALQVGVVAPASIINPIKEPTNRCRASCATPAENTPAT